MVKELLIALLITFSVAEVPGEIYEGDLSIEYRNVTVYAPAVAQSGGKYVGVISTITVTIQNHGSGRVFIDTLPLTQIDMQGSARLAVKVASSLVKGEFDPLDYDYFFVVRTSAPIIGGPSAGAIMTAAVVSLLKNWTMDNRTVMTGMINPDGSIGPVGGILPKIDAAHTVGAKRFLIPKGQGMYPDIEEERIVENGWTKIITRQVLRNVSDYASEKYGMEVIEVEDINDVLRYYTGHYFPIKESEDAISTEDYIYSMKPLAVNLLRKAEMSCKNASSSLNNTYIPNHFPSYYRDQVQDILEKARRNVEEAKEWYEKGLYYTSTSKSFQSLIDSRFVSYACEYFDSQDRYQYVNSLLDEARKFYESKSRIAKSAEISGTISLQCVGAGQQRAFDAESHLSKAESSLKSYDYLNALSRIAYAVERSESIEWWIGIASSFNDTGKVNATTIRDAARDYIEDAQQATIYSKLILTQMGKLSNYISDAEDSLEAARENQDKGFYAAALFEALKSLVKANLALELIDGLDESKVERARERASQSISESRSLGIEPVLAVSYYELAQSLLSKDLSTCIVYYKYSDLIAGALSFETYPTRSSRYVGIPEIKIQNPYLEEMVVSTIIGCILGLCIGLLLGRPKKKKKITKAKIPRSISDYFK